MIHFGRSPGDEAPPGAGAAGVRLPRSAATLLVAYNVVEIVVAGWFSFADDSLALRVFAADSLIQFHAAGAFYRLDTSRIPMTAVQTSFTSRGTRGLLAGLLGALALYAVVVAAIRLLQGQPAVVSPVGVSLATVSVAVMGLMAWLTYRAAAQASDATLRRMSRRFVLAGHLPLVLAVGLGAAWLGGPGWADPVAAVLMVPWILKESVDAGRGSDL